MKWFKEISFQIVFLTFVFTPLVLNAQTNEQTKQNEPKSIKMDQRTQETDKFDDYTSEQLNAELAKLDGKPGEDLEREFLVIAENHARELQTKLNLDDDAYDDTKGVIADYLKNRWEARIELAKQSNDQEKANKSAADLAHLRVELIDDITDEFDDQAKNQWNNHAVDFWLSLDKAVFDLTIQKTGMASDYMNQDQKN